MRGKKKQRKTNKTRIEQHSYFRPISFTVEQKARNIFATWSDSILAIKIQYRWNESRSRLVETALLSSHESLPRAHTILGRSVGDDNAKIAISISSGGSITFSAVSTFIHSVSGRSVIYAEVTGYHSGEKIHINGGAVLQFMKSREDILNNIKSTLKENKLQLWEKSIVNWYIFLYIFFEWIIYRL